MEHKRNIDRRAYLAEPVYTELRLCLINSVRRADSDGERVNPGSRKILLGFLWRRVHIRQQVVPRPGVSDVAYLSLDRRAEGMSYSHDLARFLYIRLIVSGGAVEHNRGKSELQCLHTLKGQTVVIMDDHRHARTLCGGDYRRGDELQLSVRKKNLRRSYDYRGAELLRRGYCRLEHVRIGSIEEPYRVVLPLCLFQHVVKIYKHIKPPGVTADNTDFAP